MTAARPIRPIDQNLNYAQANQIEHVISDAIAAELTANKASLETQLSYDTQADIKALDDIATEVKNLEKKSNTEKSAIILGQVLALFAAIEERYKTWLYTLSNLKNYALYQHLQNNITPLLNISAQPKIEALSSSEEMQNKIQESVEIALEDEETKKAKAELNARLANEMQLKLNFAKQQALIAFYNYKKDPKVVKLISQMDLNADIKAKAPLAKPGQEEKVPSTKVIQSSLEKNAHPSKTYTLRNSAEEAANIARNQREGRAREKFQGVAIDLDLVNNRGAKKKKAALRAITDINVQTHHKAFDAASTAFRQERAGKQMETARLDMKARQAAAKKTDLFKVIPDILKTVLTPEKEVSPEQKSDSSPSMTRR